MNTYVQDQYLSWKMWSRRWMLAFSAQTALLFVVVMILVGVLRREHIVPIPIHIDEAHHRVWVDAPNSAMLSIDDAMIKSDLIRYVRNRESYSSSDELYRRKAIFVTTSEKLLDEFRRSLSSEAVLARAKRFGEHGYRQITIRNTSILSRKSEVSELSKSVGSNQGNLARVEFTAIDHTDGAERKSDWVATLAWDYLGTPNDELMAWDNPLGLVITRYTLDRAL